MFLLIMDTEKIKKEIIDSLTLTHCCSYIDEQENLSDEDWQDISNAVGLDIYYDPKGLTYTSKGFGAFFKMKKYNKG